MSPWKNGVLVNWIEMPSTHGRAESIETPLFRVRLNAEGERRRDTGERLTGTHYLVEVRRGDDWYAVPFCQSVEFNIESPDSPASLTITTRA